MADLHLEVLALCNYADYSKDGKLSISGIFDEIFAQTFPAQFLRGFLVFTLAGAKPNEEYELMVTITSPSGEKVLEKEAKITAGRNGKGNFIAELITLPLPVSGEYKVSVSYKKDFSTETSLFVTATGGNKSGTKSTDKTIN